MNKFISTSKPIVFLTALTFICCSFEQIAFADNSAQQEIKASRPAEKGCVWKKLESSAPKISLIYQECDYGFRKITQSIAGNSVVQKYSDAGDSAPDKVIELFTKDSNESPAVALKKQFIDKLSDYEKVHCVAKETKDKNLLENPFKDGKKSAWVIEPDKEYAAKIAKETPEGDMPENSCGEYGLPVDFRAYFEFHANNPAKFAWVVIGQDTPLFDEQSLDF